MMVMQSCIPSCCPLRYGQWIPSRCSLHAHMLTCYALTQPAAVQDCARAAGACREWLPLPSCRTERQLHPQTHPWRLVDLKGKLVQDYVATSQEQQTVQVKAQPGARPAADLDASSHLPFRGFDGLGRSQQEYLGAEVSFQTAGLGRSESCRCPRPLQLCQRLICIAVCPQWFQWLSEAAPALPPASAPAPGCCNRPCASAPLR